MASRTAAAEPAWRSLALRCARCRHSHSLDELAWRCGRCGGVLDLAEFSGAFPGPAVRNVVQNGLWRYADALPLPEVAGISMGEGGTPLVPLATGGIAVKLDYLMPTGSFKDRGAAMLVTLARLLGVRRMLVDSSGNAGAAVAAYASRAGIACEVYVPAFTSPGKIAQLRAYGASVHQISGSREATADAAAEAATKPGVFYASHVYQPLFFHGTKTYVFEIFDALDGHLPDTLVLPVGNGTLVLGAHIACRELLDQGLIDRLPRLVGVQAAACAPLTAGPVPPVEGTAPASAVVDGPGFDSALSRRVVDTATRQCSTIAEGIAIADPARRDQILVAVAESGGEIVAVSENEIRRAQQDLAGQGFYVEPTSAVCWAAVRVGLVPAPRHDMQSAMTRSPVPHTVIPLCGSGLKT